MKKRTVSQENRNKKYFTNLKKTKKVEKYQNIECIGNYIGSLTFHNTIVTILSLNHSFSQMKTNKMTLYLLLQLQCLYSAFEFWKGAMSIENTCILCIISIFLPYTISFFFVQKYSL